ncbi:MAG: protein-glutamate O-methyltransferase CheR [Eubacteriales bacterium]|nr:protein-glutamate O-methyltransferase CheR [Eubacteriales bacterium]
MIRLSDSELSFIVEYMRENFGINLEKKKVLIECRLSKEAERAGANSFGKYFQMLRQDRTGKIAEGMVNRLTTNYTYFMREPAHFSILTEKILPQVLADGRSGFCNIWCAGCSTGEESYTLAMLLQDFKEKQPGSFQSIRILATDISEEVLECARKGIYPMSELDSIPPQWQKKYCNIIDKKHFKLDEKLKYYIQFDKQNLMDDGKLTDKFDFIFCRNVMIYFDKNSKAKVLKRLERSLKPGGYLFVGLAELLYRDETELKSVYPAVYKKE